MAEPKPIYQLYDEWLVRHQMCKICKHQVQGPVQGPYEKYDPPKTVQGQTMEEHIRKEHPDEITEVWK